MSVSSVMFCGGLLGVEPDLLKDVLVVPQRACVGVIGQRIELALVVSLFPGEGEVVLLLDATLAGQVGQVGQEALGGELRDDKAVELVDVRGSAAGDRRQQLLVSLGALLLGDVGAVDLDVGVLLLRTCRSSSWWSLRPRRSASPTTRPSSARCRRLLGRPLRRQPPVRRPWASSPATRRQERCADQPGRAAEEFAPADRRLTRTVLRSHSAVLLWIHWSHLVRCPVPPPPFPPPLSPTSTG